MKVSKKSGQLIDKLDKLEKYMNYYTNKPNLFREDFDSLKKFIEETSIDRKIDHARFAKWLKWTWNTKKD